MKGLLLKDFYLVRATLAIILVTYAVIGIGMSIMSDPWITVVIGAVMFGIMSASTINMDKQYGWNKFEVTLPVSKARIVDSKYLLYLLFSVLGFVVGVALSLIICAVKPDIMPADEMIRLYLSIAAAMALFAGGVQIPGNFLLSAEKAMITLIVACPLLTGIFGTARECRHKLGRVAMRPAPALDHENVFHDGSSFRFFPLYTDKQHPSATYDAKKRSLHVIAFYRS